MRRTIQRRSLGSQHSGLRSRSWGGRKAAISGSNFAGAPLIRIGSERSQKSWSICGPTRSLVRAHPRSACLPGRTRTIPIVFAGVTDPIGAGFAANLSHPGGNITGFTVNDPAVGGKWVQLLKEIAPRTVRVALLFNPATAVPIQFFTPSIQAAASSFAVEVSTAPVHTKDEVEGVIAAQAR